MENLSQVKELFAQFYDILLAKRQIAKLEKDIALEKRHLEELGKQVDAELADVHLLQEHSLRSLFIRILKDYDEQLKKENQEYLMAVLQYDESARLIKLLTNQVNELKRKVDHQEFIEKDISRKIARIEDDVLRTESIYISEYARVTKEVQRLTYLKVEINEAYDMTLLLEESFLDLISYLNNARKYDNWGKFYSERQEGKVKHKYYIDKANGKMLEIKKLLITLQDEISDVIELKELFKRSEVLLQSFNLVFYDRLIADWIAKLDLSETLAVSIDAEKTFGGLQQSLRALMENVEEEYHNHCQKREEIIALIQEKK